METKILNGEIQDLTDKSIKINNYWLNTFNKELLQGFKKGDEVEVIYTDNTKNNKVYHNLKVLKLTSKEKEIVIYKIDNQLASILTSYVKDIIIAHLQNDLDYNIETITNKVIKSFKQIKEI
jgi:hypothetical protein